MQLVQGDGQTEEKVREPMDPVSKLFLIFGALGLGMVMAGALWIASDIKQQRRGRKLPSYKGSREGEFD